MQVWSAIIFANLVWGLAPILAKTGLQYVNEIDFLLVRFALSSLFLSPWVLSGVKKLGRLSAGKVLLGIVSVSANYYLQVFALKQAPVTWYVFFYALCPILSVFVIRIALSARLAVAVGVACLGIWIFTDLQKSNIDGVTLAALIMNVVSWVLFTWSIQSWQKILDDAEISGAVSFLSLFVFLSIAVMRSEWTMAGWNTFSLIPTLALAVLLPAAFFAYSFALRKRAGLAIIGQYAEPVFGTLGGVLILHETVSARQMTGLFIVVCALMVSRKA